MACQIEDDRLDGCSDSERPHPIRTGRVLWLPPKTHSPKIAISTKRQPFEWLLFFRLLRNGLTVFLFTIFIYGMKDFSI